MDRNNQEIIIPMLQIRSLMLTQVTCLESGGILHATESEPKRVPSKILPLTSFFFNESGQITTILL